MNPAKATQFARLLTPITSLAVAGVVGLLASAGAGASSPSVVAASAGQQAGARLPLQQGTSERFSEILDRSRADRRPLSGAPTVAPEHRPRPSPAPSQEGLSPRAGRPAPGQRAGAPVLGASFLGAQLSEAGAIPPDSMGAVGPTQVMVVVNGRLRVFTKTGSLQFDADLDNFFQSVREGSSVSDPHVRYDRLSGRWFLSAINIADPQNKVLIAVSSGSTISNQTSFTFFSFGRTGIFADFPTLAVDRSALYIGTNDFVGPNLVSTTGFVVRKSALLNGNLVAFSFTLASALSDGPFSPAGAQSDDPSASEGYFIGADSGFFGLLDIRRVSDPGGTPTVSANLAVAVPPTTFPINVPAQGTSTSLDGGLDDLVGAMIAKDSVTGAPHLWTSQQIEVDSSGNASTTGGRDGLRWYDIVNLTGTPALAQSGTVFDPAATNPSYYWMSSIATNGQGQSVLGSSVAGVGRFAGIALAQRFRGDPPGTMSAPLLAQPGVAPYDITVTDPQRWGDYSQTVVDPNDDMTFWTFQEYANATNSWGVRAIQVRARPPATPSAAALVRRAAVAAAAAPARIPLGRRSVRVRITGTSSNDSGFFDPGPDTGGPGFDSHISAAVSGRVKIRGVTFLNPTHLILDLNTRRAALGPKRLTITNPDGQAVSARGLLTIVDETPPQTTISGPRRTDDKTPTFRFRSNEPGSRFKCELDRSRFRACRSPKTLPPLDPGEHTFKVKAIDRAGNVDRTAARHRFTILP